MSRSVERLVGKLSTLQGPHCRNSDYEIHLISTLRFVAFREHIALGLVQQPVKKSAPTSSAVFLKGSCLSLSSSSLASGSPLRPLLNLFTVEVTDSGPGSDPLLRDRVANLERLSVVAIADDGGKLD